MTLRRTKSSSQRSAEVQEAIEGYRMEGLIEPGWEPLGDTDRERHSSLEARAYTAWLRKHADACGNRAAETCRSMFQMRHDASWRPQELEIVPIGLAEPPPVSGFSTASRALPKGDAWEAEDPQPAEDVPPPAEEG